MKVFTKVAAVAAVVLAVCVAVSCSLFNPLYGTKWSATPSEGYTVELSFTTMSDFTEKVTYEGGSQSVEGTYTYDSGDVELTMTVDGETYTISGTVDGNTLTLGVVEFTKE